MKIMFILGNWERKTNFGIYIKSKQIQLFVQLLIFYFINLKITNLNDIFIEPLKKFISDELDTYKVSKLIKKNNNNIQFFNKFLYLIKFL